MTVTVRQFIRLLIDQQNISIYEKCFFPHKSWINVCKLQSEFKRREELEEINYSRLLSPQYDVITARLRHDGNTGWLDVSFTTRGG